MSFTGLQIKNYRVLEKLGDGGMAEVYLALHTSLQQPFAIKFIRAELSLDDKFCTRFEREARISARLTHPNIVRVFDLGVYKDRYFLVMEYIRGITLKDYLKKHISSGSPLTLDEIVTIITQIGEALAYIHQVGVIHRDVKPDNILISPDGRACLSDFGVARIIGMDGDQTGSGAILGTPMYMPPEHILSDGTRISPASDIYSLGVILYEMLTGKPPYTANTPILVMLKHLNEPIPELTTTLVDIPDALDLVVQTALAKDPRDRYQDVHTFIHALQEALDITVRLARLNPEPAIC